MMTDHSESSLSTKIQLGGVVIGILAIIVTVIFSVRSERTKEISVKHLAKRQLVSVEGSRTSVGLEVRLGGNRIEVPWLFSGRLENTGNQPIEERDIEAPTTLHFSKAKIVGAEITSTSQQALAASNTFAKDKVMLHHKLLNPGDWVSFDILFDGEPDLPQISSRISGISNPKLIALSADPQQIHLAIIPLPMPVIYLMLAVCSLISVAVAGWILVLSGMDMARRLLPKTREQVILSYADRLRSISVELLSDLKPTSYKGRILYVALGINKENSPKLDILDNRASLLIFVRNSCNSEFLKSLDLDYESATNLLIEELKENYKMKIANSLKRMLSPKLGDEAQRAIQLVNAQTATMTELLDRAIELVKDIKIEEKELSRHYFGFAELMFFLLALSTALSFVGLLGGTWRTLLGI